MSAITYVALENALKGIESSAVDNGAGEPPAGYEQLEGDALRIADECWHAGMDAMKTAILNWAHDTELAPGLAEIIKDVPQVTKADYDFVRDVGKHQVAEYGIREDGTAWISIGDVNNPPHAACDVELPEWALKRIGLTKWQLEPEAPWPGELP